ncbi:hypothetical protein [Rhodococcus sp. NPDC006774]|uniref:hypothetical protein n=1 Tax=Rhodococcus sp. NPDC006774 TaxID=3157186 RepID=UPI0034080FD9
MSSVRTCGTTRLGLPPVAAALAIGSALMLVAAFAPLPPLWVLVIYGAAMAAGAVALIISARQRRDEQDGGQR